MRKFLMGLAIALLGVPTVSMAGCCSSTCCVPYYEFDLAAGYRRDSLKWSIAGPKGVPDVLSELTWKDIKSTQVMASAKMITCDNIYLSISGDYGKIYHGVNHDSDFLGNDRTLEFSKTEAKADRGYVADASAGIGYFFGFVGGRVILIPTVGYSINEQHFKQRDLFVELDLISGFSGPLSGLNSSYKTRWYGPWGGLEFAFRMTRQLTLFGSGEYHIARFRARGDWNLRTDFIRDFKQHGDAYGQIYTLGISYSCSRRWSASVVANLIRFRTCHGEDRTFFADGSIETHLNPVRWHSYSIMGMLTYRY